MISTKTNEIDLLVTPGFNSLEVAGFLSVLSAANTHMRINGTIDAYRFRVSSFEEGVVPSDSVICVPAKSIKNLKEGGDTLIVAGHKNHREISSIFTDPASLITTAFPKAERIALLLTDNKIHGNRKSPHNIMKTNQLYFIDNQPNSQSNLKDRSTQLLKDKKLTYRDLRSGIEIALEIVTMDYGDELSTIIKNKLQNYISIEKDISHNLSLPLSSAETKKVKDIQRWIEKRFDEKLNTEKIASQFSISTRHLNRIFCSETGITPAMYLESVRLAKSLELIEKTSLPLKTIAFKSGFSSTQRMRRAFIKNFSMTPTAYRRSSFLKS